MILAKSHRGDSMRRSTAYRLGNALSFLIDTFPVIGSAMTFAVAIRNADELTIGRSPR